MASNNKWDPPLPQRKKATAHRKSHDKLLSQLREMFGSNFEADIISSVAENCDWKLERSIDTLITLSSGGQPPLKQESPVAELQEFQKMPIYSSSYGAEMFDPWPVDESATESLLEYQPAKVTEHEPEKDLMSFEDNELQQQQEELRKFELAKAKEEESRREPSEPGQKHVETASLCGLKVQYRPRGMENNSDDDADVVIEEESSNVSFETPESTQANVCQFLAMTTESAPRNTFPPVNYISTPSPPCTPRHVARKTQQTEISPVAYIESINRQGYKLLILMRGVPGSGKSYLARSIVSKVQGIKDATLHVLSTDDYFSLINRGVYVFDITKLQDAHTFNQNRVLNAMREGRSPLIVDNTNTQAWEMKAYAAMAVRYGYIVETLEPNTSWSRNVNVLEKRNKHHVPKAKIRQMLERYEPNISGEYLLKMYNLYYDPCNQPPQIRSCPLIGQDLLAQRVHELSINDTASSLVSPFYNSPIDQEILGQNWQTPVTNCLSPVPTQSRPRCDNQQNLEERYGSIMKSSSPLPSMTYTPANQNIMSQRNPISATNSPPPLLVQRRVRKSKKSVIKESTQKDNHQGIGRACLSQIAKEYAELDTNFNNTSDMIDDKPTNEVNDSWTEGTSFKEENSLDLMKLGAIGSERKGTTAISKDSESNSEEESTARNSPTQMQQAIGSERKNSVHALDNFQIPEQKVETNFNNTSDIVDDKPTNEANDSWTEGTSFKEESSLDLMKLGAIGSERKGATAISKDSESNSEEEKTSGNSPTQMQQAIGFERKNSVHMLDNFQSLEQKVEQIEESNLDSPYTKLSEQPAIENDDSTLKIEIVYNDAVQTCSENSEIESISKEDEKTSSDSSLERVSDVDISQYELCSTEILQQPTTVENQDIEKQASGGFGSLLNFLKNSFLGNEKENDETSSKISNLSINIKKQNLNQNTQKAVGLLNTSEAASSSEVDQFFEARDSMNEDLSESGIVSSVVEQLLEASSDFQLVEQEECTEIRMATKNREETSNIMSEKNFSDQMKNLQIVADSEEDENKVSKEPIDKVFVSKNTFPEKIQNISRNFLGVDWQEEPFPYDELITSIESGAQQESPKPKPQMRDSSTFTDPYDFNVAFIGGTDEYRVIETTNRSINDPDMKNDVDAYFSSDTSSKLLLHKGTMTNKGSMLDSSVLFDHDIEPATEDRSQELIDKYPFVPADCVRDIYENMCKRDYNWAFEYLKSLIEDDTSIATADSVALTAQSQFFTSNKIAESRQHSSTSESSTENAVTCLESSPIRSSRRSRDQHTTAELKRYLENKFVLSEESYKPHTLRVKRWKNRDFSPKRSEVEDTVNLVQLEPMQSTTIPSLDTKKPTRLDNPAVVEEQPITGDPDSGSEESSKKEEETMELELGFDLIRVLEENFGNSDFPIMSDGLFPVIRIKKSMAQELHALWVESMLRQLWDLQNQLESMIARDAEYARELASQGAEEEDRPVSSPNLREIIDMEMALASYKNDLVSKRKNKNAKYRKESPNEISLRVAQQTLQEMFPHYDTETLHAIYDAHERNFEVTVRVIEENCMYKSKVTMADIIKKRKDLIGELQKSVYKTSSHNQLEMDEGRDEASGGYDYSDDEENPLTYEDAVKLADEQRREARRHSNLRNNNYQKALEAMRKKSPEVAAYYSEMARLHIKKMELANSMAASAILAAQAYTLDGEDKLDLHYLRVREAKQALNVYLDDQFQGMSTGERKHIFIITGRGARSTNGQSKIKPAIAKELNNRGITFSEENPGMLKATLRK